MRRRQRRIIKIAIFFLSALAILSGFFIIFHDMTVDLRKSSVNSDGFSGFDAAGVSKRVLFLSANRLDSPVFMAQKDGISEVLAKEGVVLDEMLIDSYVGSEFGEELVSQSILCRMEGKPKYDAVLTGDDVSLDFVENHGDELFPGTPVVFLGLTKIKHAQKAAGNPLMTGSVNIRCISEILDIAIPQNPAAHYITAILDGSAIAHGDEKQFYSFRTKYPDYVFGSMNISSMSFDDLKQKLSGLDSSTILIYLSGNEDSQGRRYSVPDMARFISSNARIPVYTDVKDAIGYGFVGGCVNDDAESGRYAARTLVSIFNGTDIASLPLFTKNSINYRFDYRAVKSLGLDFKAVPKNTEWVNRTQGIWSLNGRTLIALLLIFLGGVMIIGVLSVMTFNSRIIQKELKSSRKQLEYMVSHDFLTGLPKIQTAHQVISELICSGTRFSVMKINITNFKGINDAYTHGCGDSVLRKVASMLMELDMAEYFVARDGSEFMVVYRKGYLSEVSQHFEHLRTTFLSIPFTYNGVNFDINTKMGIFNVPVESTLSDDEVVSAVNYALYVAKAGGKYKYVFFTDEMQEKIRNTKEVIKILDEACENDGFEAFFQPQIDVGSGQIFGYESLCRLKNHTISPALFIPVAESNGFITKIGRIMTEKVIKQMASMRDDGLPLRQFAINYSAGQIVDTGYVAYLKSLLEEYDIPPNMIEIEITESLYLGKDQDSANLFRQLEELGVGLALDDFGTGYSSISYLTYVPVGVVKIDKTMVDIYLHDGKDVLIKNIINMVHSLGMKLIAEGIEEEWQYQKLKKFDCDVIQGYYFGKPMRGIDVKKFSV